VVRQGAQVGWLDTIQMIKDAGLVQAERPSRLCVPHMAAMARVINARIKAQKGRDFVWRRHKLKIIIIL
jgi:hypothetical protein